jgi:hypothetical protein
MSALVDLVEDVGAPTALHAATQAAVGGSPTEGGGPAPAGGGGRAAKGTKNRAAKITAAEVSQSPISGLANGSEIMIRDN